MRMRAPAVARAAAGQAGKAQAEAPQARGPDISPSESTASCRPLFLPAFEEDASP